AARAQAKLAPLRLQHLTVQAVFSHWQGFSAQLRAARLLTPLLMERLDLAVLRACFSGWRDVYGRNPAARSRAKAYDWTTRRSRCFTRVLCKAVEQTSQVTAESAARAALLSWCREVQRLRGQRLGTSQQLSDLHAITCMVWTQDQGRELMSHTITAWHAGVTQSRLETSRLRAGSRRAALLQSAQRLTDREPLLRLSFAFSIWRSLQVRRRWALVLSRGAGRGSLALLQSCLACWQREAASGASGRQIARRRRNHMKLSEAFASQDRLVALLGDWLLRWHCIVLVQRAGKFEEELELLAGLLQESTITCRELRTQLLTLRGSSYRIGRTAMFAIFVAWQRTMVPEGHISLPSAPATSTPAARATASTPLSVRRLSTSTASR
ncbi:unnamed protein product, partial [Effrenium voratum]